MVVYISGTLPRLIYPAANQVDPNLLPLQPASGHAAGAATGGRTTAASAKRPGERQRSWLVEKKCTKS